LVCFPPSAAVAGADATTASATAVAAIASVGKMPAMSFMMYFAMLVGYSLNSATLTKPIFFM
jgi:hypothetical protein